MSFTKIGPGDHVPDEVNVVIEIPANSEPVKYEVDKETDLLFVDRFMSTCMRYPCNYGYIPQTLSEDNDPVDVLVICQFPLISGTVVRSRVIGILDMVDEAGSDSKLLAVPTTELTPLYHKLQKPEDVSPAILDAIEHFFRHYKDLEPDKWVKIIGWKGADEAKKEIVESVERYQAYVRS